MKDTYGLTVGLNNILGLNHKKASLKIGQMVYFLENRSFKKFQVADTFTG